MGDSFQVERAETHNRMVRENQEKWEGGNFRIQFSQLSTREKKLASDVPRRLSCYGRELPPLQLCEGREHYSAHHGQTFRATLINRILGGVMIASERRQIDDVN